MWAVGFVHMNILNPQNSCVCGTYGTGVLPSLKFYTIPKPENDAKVSACKKTCVFFKVKDTCFPVHQTNNYCEVT